ncbi:MAG: hypothetical protein JWP11_1006 [Frankiales bacterium]|jgi:hypothetical protein|nr:hypothetical protein [Frankiales bacterium]
MTRPHDLTDLHLAPVLLALDARLAELGALDVAELGQRVALDSDRPDRTAKQRAEGLLATVEHLLDAHHWDLCWDVRGLRIAHGLNSVVLGVPPVFAEFLAERLPVPAAASG